MTDTGEEMYQWATDLFPLCRSLTGSGVRETLAYLADLMPDLQIHQVPSGTQAFDWTVPDEWNITSAYLEDENGTRIVDFADHNLHVLGYSEPVDQWLDRCELDEHLYSIPEQPDLIPYVTSYYKRRWGFCLPDRLRRQLSDGRYHAVIDATLEAGSLTYGELIIPGRTDKEMFLSTYICHPSMANNELSGVVVTAALARWLSTLQDRHYTYRIVWAPETIGAITYLSKNLEAMQRNVVAGYVVTCVGDDRVVSFMPSRTGDTLADRAARHVLRHRTPEYIEYSFLTRGSDERQYCSPLVDLPVASIMRSKYGEFPEYHTSADNLSLISPGGLAKSFGLYRDCLQLLAANFAYCPTVPCEPQLSPRGLYPDISMKNPAQSVRNMMNVLAYSDGSLDLIELSEKIEMYGLDVATIAETLLDHKLVRRCDQTGDSPS